VISLCLVICATAHTYCSSPLCQLFTPCTLSIGKPVLTDEVAFGAARNWGAHAVLKLAAACERGSEHPVGQTIVRAAQNSGLSLAAVDNFEVQLLLIVACGIHLAQLETELLSVSLACSALVNL
jgi:cation transport ATPase